MQVCLKPFLLVVLLALSQCTNFSSSVAVAVPPILISAAKNSETNFTLRVRATNPELIFQGYRLYVANREIDSRNPGDVNAGTDCNLAGGTLTLLPVQPIEYVFEIDPATTAPGAGVACRFRTTASTGQFVTVRSLGLSVQVSLSTSSLRVSGPSNSLLLP